MFPLGHLGLPLGVARALRRRRDPRPLPPGAGWLALGALGPDLVDKPLSLLAEPLSNGRTFGHTLASALFLLLVGGLARRGRRARAPLLLALGWASHLVLDRMWNRPETLFWPLLGASFPRGEPIRHPGALLAFLRDPWNLGGEVAGGLVLALLAWEALRLRRRAREGA